MLPKRGAAELDHESQPILIRASRIVDPSRSFDGPGALLIGGERILASGTEAAVLSEMEEGEQFRIHEVPDGWVVAPGLVDLHTHLREPGFEAKETINTGALAAVRGGFTTICCMPNTYPVIDSRATIEFVQRAAAEAPARVYPVAAITKGESGEALVEMVELAGAGAVAFSDDGLPVGSSRVLRLALEYASPLGLPIVEHCQDADLAGAGVMNEGQVSTLLGLRGWPAAAEEIMLARDLQLVRLTGARYHAAHLSSAGSVALIRAAKQEGLPVSAEVSPHHLLLTDSWVAGQRTGPLAGALAGLQMPLPPGERYDTNTKVNPPLRQVSDCLALLEGVRDGTIDAIATDHAPHSWVDKACEFDSAAFGISGLETALAALLALVHTGEISLSSLIAALSERPARAWNLEGGTLQAGAPADLLIFDPLEVWTVDPAGFTSLGHNTPLAGVSLRGRVRETWKGGRHVYEAE
jgi:dihydroorotase